MKWNLRARHRPQKHIDFDSVTIKVSLRLNFARTMNHMNYALDAHLGELNQNSNCKLVFLRGADSIARPKYTISAPLI